jgi:hypothetical protein
LGWEAKKQAIVFVARHSLAMLKPEILINFQIFKFRENTRQPAIA